MDNIEYSEYMKRYEGFKQCEFCGKYDMPASKYRDYRGGMVTDTSMVCDGVQTLGPDPFAEEIHGDHSDYLMCEGARWEAAMDI